MIDLEPPPSGSRVVKSELAIRPTAYISVNLLKHLRFKWRLLIGWKIAQYLAGYRLYEVAKANQARPRLASSDVAVVAAGNDDFLQRAVRGAADITLAPRHRLTIASFDRLAAGVNSALNIGCRVDNIVADLATRFPQISFTSIDLGDQLADTHRLLYGTQPNWRVVSGYPLDLIETGQVRGDVAILCGVTTVLSNAEYRAYLLALRPTVDHLIVSDIWTASATDMDLFRICRPEAIDPDTSAIIGYWAGGRYLHNHPAILAACGYEVTSCRLHGEAADTYTIHVEARRR